MMVSAPSPPAIRPAPAPPSMVARFRPPSLSCQRCGHDGDARIGRVIVRQAEDVAELVNRDPRIVASAALQPDIGDAGDRTVRNDDGEADGIVVPGESRLTYSDVGPLRAREICAARAGIGL